MSIYMEGLIALLFIHGITFLWILIFQCAKKPPSSNKRFKHESIKGRQTASAKQKRGLSEDHGTSQASSVPPGPGVSASFAQTGNQQSTNMPASSNMTQTQQSQAGGTQASQVSSSKKPTVEDDGGYDNLNPNSKPLESVR